MEDQTTHRSLKIILLAAGLSRRLLGEQKLLKVYKGKPLFLYSLSSALKCGDVILVTGHEGERITKLANEYVHENPNLPHTLKCVKNENYEKGQYTSTIVGVMNVEDGCDFAISVSDTPFIQASDYQNLYSLLEDYDIVRPFVNGTPCHPVFFKNHVKKLFLDNTNYSSVRELINDNEKNLKILNYDYKQNSRLSSDFDYAFCFEE